MTETKTAETKTDTGYYEIRYASGSRYRTGIAGLWLARNVLTAYLNGEDYRLAYVSPGYSVLMGRVEARDYVLGILGLRSGHKTAETAYQTLGLR